MGWFPWHQRFLEWVCGWAGHGRDWPEMEQCGRCGIHMPLEVEAPMEGNELLAHDLQVIFDDLWSAEDWPDMRPNAEKAAAEFIMKHGLQLGDLLLGKAK